ncbi:carbon-nitrogen hydrolase family protein [Pseudomonas stutzeri]|uniref:carbon-nitrogen hydrolase family protein n=1 Tax=Stutzerimonas stutzeri TaxID=316 RepID=UPI000C9B9EFC|nr:carbon-nitrogen hydrolase family protein [Stutzerimonas stutzeri]MCQ4279462.1 carbon-nitrogen hydrolase family protein [Stutzerimonas stutzeri]PNF71998.1 amidohydrolase [Stutzerimonas stutzeri]
MSAFTLATAQYDIGFFSHWDDFAAKLERWVASAVEQDAKLLVFPEYGSMELASLFGQAVYSDLQQQLQAMQTLLPKWRDLHQALARRHDVLILASSFPTELQAGHVVNRATLFGPEGILGHQDKLIMTRFENEQWCIRAGERIGVIDTELGRIGILICYDSEFPMIARQQITAGAELLLVPSCTDTQAGFHRVRIGCQARALENQCYVVQSPTTGLALWSEAVDINTGRASVYTPVDYGFPDNGILVEGADDEANWVFATLDLRELARIRAEGQVFNHRDWPKQLAFKGPEQAAFS